MDIHPLLAISPLDGRYHGLTAVFSDYFSEYALIKKRICIEISYLMAFIGQQGICESTVDETALKKIQHICNGFGTVEAKMVKDIEKVTNHDVKAVEYYIRQKLDEAGLSVYRELVHFGLTSQDVNNTAMPMLLKEAHEKVMMPVFRELELRLTELSDAYATVPMLARTHGQAASPTLLGKEFYVFAERLHKQMENFQYIPFEGKFGGATGNFNAHYIAYPKINWHAFADSFLNELGLKRQQTTTQIEHYDQMAAYFDNIRRINVIFTDFCRDMWAYISMDYFKQKIREGEVGSSAMPHKVNPIDFENAEGNLGMANALLEHLSAKLPVSRLQRDLTDSTVSRNIGVPLAHTFIALKSIQKGLDKLLLNEQKINDDLEENWVVVAEAIQTVLRRENYREPYEALKKLTRKHHKPRREDIASFIDSLDVSESVKKELKAISPQNYTGVFKMKKP